MPIWHCLKLHQAFSTKKWVFLMFPTQPWAMAAGRWVHTHLGVVHEAVMQAFPKQCCQSLPACWWCHSSCSSWYSTTHHPGHATGHLTHSRFISGNILSSWLPCSLLDPQVQVVLRWYLHCTISHSLSCFHFPPHFLLLGLPLFTPFLSHSPLYSLLLYTHWMSSLSPDFRARLRFAYHVPWWAWLEVGF